MFKVAVVGCGFISNLKYIPLIQRMRDKAVIVGICDLNENTLKHSAGEFGISNTYMDFSKMLKEQKPDVVVVCTPPQTHMKLVVEALERRAHVLVEKPMALSARDCQEMIEASRQSDRRLGVMHNQIFNPAFQKAYKMFSKGKLGNFLGMRVFLATPLDSMTKDSNHWAHRLPGGVFGETGPHAVYLSMAFLRNVRDVSVHIKRHFPEFAWSIGEDIRFDLIADNGLSSVTLIYGSNQIAGEVDIIGTKGILKVDLQTRTLVNYSRQGNNSKISPKAISKSVLKNIYQTTTSFIINGIQYVFTKSLDCHYIGLQRFFEYLEGRAEFGADGEKGKEVTKIMETVAVKMKQYKQKDSRRLIAAG